MDISPRLKISEFTNKDEKYHTCALCGGNAYKRIEVKFESGSTEPVEDETITTASGDTGVMTDTTVVIISGTWAGGDAAGYCELEDATGVSERLWGVDGEAATGGSGASFTLDGQGIEKTYGIHYPLSELYFYRGKWYCSTHYQMLSKFYEEDKVVAKLFEHDRGKFP